MHLKAFKPSEETVTLVEQLNDEDVKFILMTVKNVGGELAHETHAHAAELEVLELGVGRLGRGEVEGVAVVDEGHAEPGGHLLHRIPGVRGARVRHDVREGLLHRQGRATLEGAVRVGGEDGLLDDVHRSDVRRRLVGASDGEALLGGGGCRDGG